MVGVGSTLDKPGLFTISSGADCTGAEARAHYALPNVEKAVIIEAFAAAGVAPWLEGQPDPRASLKAFGEACAADAECKSNACVTDLAGTHRCSTGCLGHASTQAPTTGIASCPGGFECATIDGHERCREAAPADAGAASSRAAADDGGCAISGAGSGPGASWVLALAVLALRSRRRSEGVGQEKA